MHISFFQESSIERDDIKDPFTEVLQFTVICNMYAKEEKLVL